MKQIAMSRLIQEEINALELLKKALEEEVYLLREGNFSDYNQFITRKQKLFDNVIAAQSRRREQFPKATLKHFMSEGEEELELAKTYLNMGSEIQTLNESTRLLLEMEKSYISTIIDSVGKEASGELTYGKTGGYESVQEVESAIISRDF